MSLESKGMIDILVMLRDGDRSFSELRRLKLSPNTVLARIREAQERGLVKQKLVPQGGKKPLIKYELANEGKRALREFESIITGYLELRSELDEIVRLERDKENEIKHLLLKSKSGFTPKARLKKRGKLINVHQQR